ncbi:hypothetical protein K456DRAFT_1743743 [Colletotrichum gloeosporioides 23]|nr:hypothetical protein K456DRAFT_1743743 [Colletotrichum gloeosporioides 23]
MSQIREARVAKRPGNSNGEPGKRRAPYALRACDACRRRKGKCDGRQPCKYCAGRDQACSYDSFLGTEEWPQAIVETIQRQEKRNSSSPSSSCGTSSNNQDAIMEILSSLQGQLNSLASRVQTSSQSPPEPTFEATDCNNEDFLSTLMNDATAIGDYVGAIEQNWQNPPRPIYGLPSPDNSLNASSQSQSQAEPPRGSFSATQSRHPPHLNVTSDIEFNEVVFTQDKAAAVQTQTPACDASALLKFRELMSLKDVRRLLGVYQEVIGDLHPIVDIDEVQTRARNCYTDGDSTTWEFFTEPVEVASEDDLLILNLALLIGLHADATPSKHESESIIRESIQPAISSKLAAPRSTMNGVIIVLLKGAYDFFNDTPQSAWRMCGTAGRMLMELGFHNGVMSEDMLDSRAQRTEVWALMSSIVILDRQWSAAAGLPRNFQESAFGPINTSSIKLPYLEAMLTFIKLSDKFSDPISQATKSQRYDEEEAFEVMNFRIEQWRKRAVADPSIIQLWHSNPLSQPPTWKILLNLRAESVRSLLFKPHFFSKADVQTSKQYLRPAIEVLFDVCNVLYNLNTTTDIYRKQQPFYQPLLASASGLGFVLTSFLEHNRSAVLATLSTEVAGAMGRSYEMAVALATGYAKISRASQGLAEKLSEVRESLTGLGMLERPRNCRTGSQVAQFSTDHPSRLGADVAVESEVAGTLAGISSVNNTESGWDGLLGIDWTTGGEASTVLSESIF